MLHRIIFSMLIFEKITEPKSIVVINCWISVVMKQISIDVTNKVVVN